MFLPTTIQECKTLGWQKLDVILISGDSYIDSPFNGIAVIGKVLVNAGFTVGVIAQPDINSPVDITRLGEPELFWGISAGVVDSMVANYTASRKRRQSDDNTPGGINNRRPDRAAISYTNLIRRYHKNTRPIVLGGIEASLRRLAHYDYWSDRVRASILLDAKADLLLYGMAESSVVELAQKLRDGQNYQTVRGLTYISHQPPADALELAPYEVVASDKKVFIDFFHTFYRNNDPITAKTLTQKHGERWVVQNPPPATPSQNELDSIYSIEFERRQHPYYEAQGRVKALETIQFSIQTHRGCHGECNFCAIAVHEGRTVSWRSQDSIVREAERMASMADFKGIIQDVGGPTANMYGFECAKKLKSGSCPKRRCLYPEVCSQMKVDHTDQISLLKRLRQITGVRKVFVASGIRYDMVLADKNNGRRYLKEVVQHHVSGQMKVAPEHTENRVLHHMGKPGTEQLLRFKEQFEQISVEARKPQFLTYYLIAAHPGCSEDDMRRLRTFTSQKLRIHPEQVQIFTPTPSTYSSLMYYTEMDSFTGEKLFVEKEVGRKERQKRIVVEKEALPGRVNRVRK